MPDYQALDSKPFRFHYRMRSAYAAQTEPMRLHGVHDVGHLKTTVDLFHAALEAYQQAGWRLQAEHVDVYLRQSPSAEALTLYYGIPGRPIEIWVAPRHEDAGGPTNRARMEFAVAHEIFHAIQLGLRPTSLDEEDPWAWFGEATAAFMESEIFPGNQQYLRYLYEWFDRPGRPLDAGPDGWHKYGGLLFCQYLRDRFAGTDVLREVWSRAGRFDTPFEALHDWLTDGRGERTPFASADAADLFANEFLAWNFFLDGTPSRYANGDLLRRLFQHAWAGPVRCGSNREGEFEIRVPIGPLAAHYHLIEVPEGVKTCLLQLEIVSGPTRSGLLAADPPGKGVVHLVRKPKEGEYGVACGSQPTIVLVPWERAFGQTQVLDLASLEGSPGYILLIVANTTWQAEERRDIAFHRVSFAFS